jgi:hypothetical protein
MARPTRGCVERVTPAKIAAAERQQKALEMKRIGATYQQIANALGYRNRSSAADAVTRALRSTISKETANELRLIELARLDTMWIVLWPQVLAGDLKAVDRCLRIMERRAAICDLNAPTKVRMPVITEEDFLKAIEEVERQAAALEEAFTDDDLAEAAECG